jgi:hypothetical protein
MHFMARPLDALNVRMKSGFPTNQMTKMKSNILSLFKGLSKKNQADKTTQVRSILNR